MTRIGALPAIVSIVPVILAVSGCSDDRALVVVTPWGPSTCREVVDSIRAEGGAIDAPVRWIRLASWDDPARLIERSGRVDLLLGWPGSTLRSLERRGLLLDGDPRRVEVPDDAIDADRPPGWWSFPEDDPRIDPEARELVSRTFDRGDWEVGYSGLLERWVRPPEEESPGPDPGWGALPVGSDHPEAVRFLDRVANPSGESTALEVEPSLIVVEAELIGATAIDASDELRDAWRAIDRSEDPDALIEGLVEPPPWPPASIQEFRADPERRELLTTLAGALVRDEQARAWLVSCWERPSRPIDRASIEELATVADGRLLDEPLFLPWLRAEWTAWARQRYGRIAREAEVRGRAGVESGEPR